MSLIQLPPREESVPAPKITAQTLLDRKQAINLSTALTAYDYSTARLVTRPALTWFSLATRWHGRARL